MSLQSRQDSVFCLRVECLIGVYYIHTYEYLFRNYYFQNFKIQGAPFKFTGFLRQVSPAYNKATDTSNTAMERDFYGLLVDIFKNCEKLSYEA